MRHRSARFALLGLRLGIAWAPATALAQATPLDVADPTPRAVLVQVETSSNLATVGQSFGPLLPATYSAAGGVGTLVIPVASHEAMRAGGIPPVPGSFTPIVIQIDLATHAASSQSAGGAQAGGGQTFSFSLSALSTSGPAGFVGPTFPPLFCTSQQQVNDLCPVFPPICGKTCTLVPGSPYDPGTGKLNLVGSETQQGCDGSLCQGPFTFFTGFGDLRVFEPDVVPALPWPAAALLALLLAVAVALRIRPHADALRRRRHRLRSARARGGARLAAATRPRALGREATASGWRRATPTCARSRSIRRSTRPSRRAPGTCSRRASRCRRWTAPRTARSARW